jgi:hypothetical protein
VEIAMNALTRLIIAGAAAALFSAPAIAMEATKTASVTVADTTTAQQDCRGWGVRCDIDVAPVFCIADDKCAPALTGTALIRYDQRMDAALAD